MIDEKTLNNLLSPCRNLVTVVHRGKEYKVACGKCADCLNKRSMSMTQKCMIESQTHRYTYFFTLTYDEDNVPRMILKQEFEDSEMCTPVIVGYDDTPRLKKKCFIPEEVLRLDGWMNDPLFKKFINKSSILPRNATNKQKEYYESNTILRYIRKKDAQDFIKRLRFQVASKFDVSFRYFLCAEYGPQTFRPHFHGLLYFDSSELAENIGELVSKCWKFCKNIDSSFANSSGASSNYLASYCNSFSRLPRYLSAKAIRPFSSHSLYFGSQINSVYREYIYEDVRRATQNLVIPSPYGIQHFAPTSANLSALFPRCYNYDNQDKECAFKLYTCFATYSKQYKTTNCSELTKLLLMEFPRPYNIIKFFNSLDLFTSDIYKTKVNGSLSLLSPVEYVELFNSPEELPEIQQIIFMRIYSALNKSRYFCRHVCVNYSHREAFDKIREFYDYRALHNLAQQYEAQQMYAERYGATNFDVFYPLSRQPDDLACSVIGAINSQRNRQYSQKIKHKQLNDENLIFVDPRNINN